MLRSRYGTTSRQPRWAALIRRAEDDDVDRDRRQRAVRPTRQRVQGDQIVLADGNYGDLDFDRIFPDRRPLIVRARTEGKVRCRIVRVLAGHVIVGIRTCEPPSSDASNEEASC
jgi:hypothetical protein